MPEHSAFFIGGIGLFLLYRDRHDAVAWGVVGISWLIGQKYAVDNLWHPRTCRPSRTGRRWSSS